MTDFFVVIFELGQVFGNFMLAYLETTFFFFSEALFVEKLS